MSIKKAIVLLSFILKGFNAGLVSSLASDCAKYVDNPHGVEFENGITNREEGSLPKATKKSSGPRLELKLDLSSVKRDGETAIPKSCLKKKGENKLYAQVGKRYKKVTFSDPETEEFIFYGEPKIKSPNFLRRLRLIKSLSFPQITKVKKSPEQEVH
ncbi:uncharacterized protein MELLADRAFT_109567 [Melampsora larici-populina 98AG31]|uniref:Secreted protein n=1 Tax=Melampsora larici-populina (strain 98AG31 / pathotype 3-4-7) TaxID=747676 RepID=F4RWW8_MELLP|nr:uncharacterized protein MELLADRAFT_109567 [Melampsora larici-populina 98AG31]EGG03096.1 hypothetical protein MELLADRAFT_109567 [Melampsora larici-populina 98AG31]